MVEKPVFQNKQEIDLWKKLSSRSWRSDEQLTEFLDSVLSRQGAVGSAVLVGCIDAAVARKLPNRKDIMVKLAAKSRPNDSLPSLTAASALIDMGEYDDADSLVTKVRGRNIPFQCCVRAKLDLARGDNDSARKNLTRARCSDTSFPMFYELMEKIDPAGGWMHRRNIELVANGREPIPFGDVAGDSMPKALFSIYADWFGGRREEATRKMVSSEEYRSKNTEYMLASARMSMDEKDWHSAQMMYISILEKRQNCVYLLCEAAEAFLSGGDSERALSYYREAEAIDPNSPRIAKGLVHTYRKLNMTDEAVQCLLSLLDSEYAGLDECKDGARRLFEWGAYNEASKLAAKIALSYPEDLEIGLMGSKIEMAKGDLNSALETAGAAMRNNPKDHACRVQYARVLKAMGRVDRAEKELEKVLKSDEKNVEALLLLKDIRMDGRDGDGAAKICRTVLNIDPSNREASEALSKAMLIGASDNADEVIAVADTGNFEDVLIQAVRSLITAGKNHEAAEMCRENEKKYPQSTMIKRLKGNAEYAMGEYLKASASFASAAVLDPGNAAIWHSKGLADEKVGDHDSAGDAFIKAIMADPKKSEYWVSRSSTLERNGDLRGAVDALNNAIAANPRSTMAMVRKARIFAGMGKPDEALCLLSMAGMADPGNALVMKAERDVCIKAGMNSRVSELTAELLSAYPADPEAVGPAAEAEITAGRKDAAFTIVDKGLSIEPDSLALLDIGKKVAYSCNDYALAVRYVEKMAAIRPDDVEIKKSLADAYARSGDANAANKMMESLQQKEAIKEIQKKPVDDSDSACEIARSLLAIGDVQGAVRVADRKLAENGKDIKMILVRAEIYAGSGDLRSADAYLSDVIRRLGQITEICEADGDIRVRLGDMQGALQRYDSAVTTGSRPTPSLHVKRGIVQEALGNIEGALNSYVSAAIKDPKNAEAYRGMAMCQMKQGNIPAAEKSIDTILITDRSAATLAVRAEISAKKKDKEGVVSAYRQYLKCNDRDAGNKEAMARALGEVGLTEDAEEFKQYGASAAKKSGAETPTSIKRLAERVLRRAYTSGTSLSDPDLMHALDIDVRTSDGVLAYLSEIQDFGDIQPGTPLFDRMETLSMNAITKGNCTGLEKDPVITIPCAFVAGGTKDSDEAKLLVAYIYKAMTSKTDKTFAAEVKSQTSGLIKGMKVEDIVNTARVGIYRAKALKESL